MTEKLIDDLLRRVQHLLDEIGSLKKESWKKLEKDIQTKKDDGLTCEFDYVRLVRLFVDFRYLCDSEYIDSLRIEYDLNLMCIILHDTILSPSDLNNLHFSFLHPGDYARLFLNY